MINLSDKTLIMAVGPVAIGKSTLMNKVAERDERFGRVSGFTSRPARSNDEPGLYRYVSPSDAEALINSDDIVQFAIHPTTGIIYGSEARDYPKEFNMLDTLSGVVAELRRLPFKRTVTVSLTTEPTIWTGWLTSRYPEQSEERSKRLSEAIRSIEWSLSQTSDHYWLLNTPGQLEQTAESLIKLVTNPSPTAVPPQADKLLERVKSLL